MAADESVNKYYTLNFSTSSAGTVSLIVGRAEGAAWSIRATTEFGFPMTPHSAGHDFLDDLGNHIASYLSSAPGNTWGTVTFTSAWSPGPGLQLV